MRLSLSLHISPWKEFLRRKVLDLYDVGTLLVRSYGGMDAEMNLSSVSFEESDSGTKLKSKKTMVIEQSLSFKNWEPEKCKLEITLSFKKKGVNNEKFDATDTQEVFKSKLESHICEFTSPKPTGELDAAAVKVQKVYKSYRTRRNLADCAVVIEELWWKALDSAALKQSSVSFFDIKRPETAVSRWSRARTRAAKVGKGLSKDEKARKLALQHWLEAIDPRHRYGHNLHYYYDIWFDSESTQPFFYWLDIGDGKEVDLETCARIVLQRQCIKYLGPKERETYEVTVDNGRLVYRQSRMFVNTSEGSKWIFVLSTSRALYVGQKKKGIFQHSSFLSGGATTAAGRLVSENGVLKAIWPYSGHYLPTEENFKEFIIFLEEHDVDLSNVKRCATDDDSPPCKAHKKPYEEEEVVCPTASDVQDSNPLKEEMESIKEAIEGADGLDNNVVDAEAPTFHLGKPLSCKWSTGNGPRIGIVRDYPADLQFRALEQVNLSPKVTPGPIESCGPIPSPRPSPKVRLSPRLAYMGHPSPRMTLPSTKLTLPIHSLAK